MTDLVEASGLSTGAIYRYFTSKDEIVTAICEQGSQAFPAELTAPAVQEFLEHIRAMAREEGHARLVAQIYAEAAISPPLAALVQQQLADLRDAVAALLPGPATSRRRPNRRSVRGSLRRLQPATRRSRRPRPSTLHHRAHGDHRPLTETGSQTNCGDTNNRRPQAANGTPRRRPSS
jgi:AcrR family transcriptional regulator